MTVWSMTLSVYQFWGVKMLYMCYMLLVNYDLIISSAVWKTEQTQLIEVYFYLFFYDLLSTTKSSTIVGNWPFINKITLV